ncbi:MAG: hypothetical protein NC340_05190 [Ruminococcus flavefaciens]|nr:hypothetical protein [Ruminococcus flavefaciens]MCM1231076.1 hypothetical protein [Ruminococcus flavefaciens]
MKNLKTKTILLSIGTAVLLSGCSQKSDENILPLLNLEWFSEISDVKDKLSDYELLEEREGLDGANSQSLLDYTGTELFETSCDLTLCFVEQGLIGFNYHDVERNNSYNEWMSRIEAIYGIPTEKGSGMASWYDDPVGKNTALYLFNLEEGVQVSFYATSNTPDKSYNKDDPDSTPDIYVPTPEIRTPIVPVIEDTATAVKTSSTTTATTSTTASGTEVRTSAVTDNSGEVVDYVEIEPEYGDESPEEPDESRQEETTTTTSAHGTTTTAVSTSSARTTTRTTTRTTVTTVTTTVTTQSKPDSFLQNGLQFYATPEFERQRMSMYTKVYEYRVDEEGEPWEIIMQYDNVPYCNKNCETVLCFTSLGLVGINYFDDDVSAYDEWVSNLTEIYGKSSESDEDYTAWDNPMGENTVVYIFALDDGVQISFFADDTGSELA